MKCNFKIYLANYAKELSCENIEITWYTLCHDQGTCYRCNDGQNMEENRQIRADYRDNPIYYLKVEFGKPARLEGTTYNLNRLSVAVHKQDFKISKQQLERLML
jgi:hypothetical protein